jgi:hypothetical protein
MLKIEVVRTVVAGIDGECNPGQNCQEKESI